jgi:uncharacterized protein
MQMTGTQRIATPSAKVWDALFDPEILRQCIPGCQSLSKESAERMRAVAEIRIGPIGARFNGTVTLSNIEAPRGYTMSIEGQGGTVGFVTSAVKVRLADDQGGTLVSYDVEAEIGGRLAQLGGPLIDATAKQLAAKFFVNLGALIGAPGGAAANASSTPVAGPSAAPQTRGSARHMPIAWMLALALAALVGYLIGHAPRGAESDWMALAIALLLIVAAGAGFVAGRRSEARR